MSLKYKAVIGAIWTISTSVGGRALGLIGTLLITRFLTPDAYGQVNTAWIFVASVGTFAALGVGQYIVANPREGDDVVFHATVYNQLATLLVLLPLPWVAPYFEASFPEFDEFFGYIPLLTIAVFIDHTGHIPSRVLARDMRFNILGIRVLLSEIVYTATALGLAAAGMGGWALAYALLVRCIVSSGVMILAVKPARWLRVSRLRASVTRRMLRFSLPMAGSNILHWYSAKADNLIIAGMFGPTTVGQYNLAYNLADIPTDHVGEHIGDVLLPSLANLDGPDRQRALVRAAGLMALLVFPLAVGLGAISETLVRALFDPRWYPMAPMLTLLSALSVFRPIGWLIASYLQAEQRTRALFFLELLKTSGICAFVYLLGRIDILWACAGVGVAFALNAWASIAVVKADDLSMWRLTKPMLQPLLATAPMVGAVVGTRALLLPTGMSPWLLVVVEILAGALVYIAAAFIVAPAHARDVVGLLRGLMRRRRGHPSEPPPASEGQA
ncbi:MAG: oligosaccharide flippase family protein [Myxococcota bacterium]